MHYCQCHWRLQSWWYPKLRLCSPVAWLQQSSVAGGGATEAPQSSPEELPQLLKEGQGLLSKQSGCLNHHWDEKMALLQIGILHPLPIFSLICNGTSFTCGQHHVGWGKGVGACHIPSKGLTTQGVTVEPSDPFHQIDKYKMVPVGHGLQLWPVIAGSARWLLYDGDADLGSWDS